jgi:MerR family mercuric resistance operon transcriptional regulator
MKTMTRGQLATLCGVGPETIRFYERRGLLPEAPRSSAGYRRFGSDAVSRLVFIRRAKSLGFSLPEITELLNLHDEPDGERARVKQITESKLREIEAKIVDLERMRTVLTDLADQCSGRGPVHGCPIIDALGAQASQAPSTEECREREVGRNG